MTAYTKLIDEANDRVADILSESAMMPRDYFTEEYLSTGFRTSGVLFVARIESRILESEQVFHLIVFPLLMPGDPVKKRWHGARTVIDEVRGAVTGASGRPVVVGGVEGWPFDEVEDAAAALADALAILKGMERIVKWDGVWVKYGAKA